MTYGPRAHRRSVARRAATAAAAIALVVASVGVGAQAAGGPSATSSASVKKQIKKLNKKVKKLNKKVKKVSKEEGPAGQDGQDGASGLDAIMGSTEVNGSSVRYAPPNGGFAGPTEAGSQILSPNRAITLSEFAADTDGVAADVVATVRVDGGDSAISCTVTTTSCTSGASVTVPARSALSLELDNQGGSDEDVRWSMTAK